MLSSSLKTFPVCKKYFRRHILKNKWYKCFPMLWVGGEFCLVELVTQNSSQRLVEKNVRHYKPPGHIVKSKCDGHRHIYEEFCKIMRARNSFKPVSKRYTVAQTYDLSCKQTERRKLRTISIKQIFLLTIIEQQAH